MVYSDTTTKQGIIQEIDFIAQSNNISFPIEDKTRSVNRALDRVAFLIHSADKAWQFEDENETDLPIAFTNLVSGQRKYTLDTTFLEILKVMVKDSEGEYRIIEQVDTYDSDYRARMILEENPSQGEGIPVVYDLYGTSLILDPIPDYNSANGIKVWLKRNVQYFDTTDTTKVAGFNPQFHRFLSLSAAYDYALTNNKDRAQQLRQEMIVMEQAIIEHYSRRNDDRIKKIVPQKIMSK